jgi:hypothetical protein
VSTGRRSLSTLVKNRTLTGEDDELEEAANQAAAEDKTI